jgi:hypothetical protein
MGMAVGLQAVSVGLGFMGAMQAKKAYELEAQSYQEQKDLAEIDSYQQENQRLKQLRIQLASLGTSMGAQGVALGTSPSTHALERDEINIANRDIDRIKLMGSGQRRKFSLSARGSKLAARGATIGAFSKSVGGIYDIYSGVSEG